MRIRINNRLIISDPTEDVKRYCKNELILDNPDYYKRNRMGKYTGNIPSKIWLYEQMGDELWLPFGCFKDIWHLHPVRDDYTYEIQPIRDLIYQDSINLYPYQEKAVESALKWKNGVLVMPCGSGKTQCGLEIIARLGGRALWLTHTHDLLMQSKQRAESMLEHGPFDFASITAGKVNVGLRITFATVQTMAKIDLSRFKDVWDIIIVDEAQHCCGSPTRVTQFYKVVSSLAARYKIGLTATPKRADGMQASMFKLLGGKICEITREQVAHNTCPIRVTVISTGYVPDYNAVLQGDGTIDYSKLIDNLIHDEERLSLVLGVALNLDGPAMILANRVEYLDRICFNLGLANKRTVCLSGKGQSKAAKEHRKACLDALNHGELDFVCATYQLAAEGLDVPNLRYVMFATPEQNETTVIQSAGRVGRKADGKSFGTVIDLVDDFGLYLGWYKKRMRYYKALNAEIVNEEVF